jgi:hypothetical protein
MSPKSIKITYWVLLGLLCLFMLSDGYGGLSMAQAGIDALHHLRYPVYIMPLMGGLKILGVIALLQTKYNGIKEWVYAGMTFIFIGAAVSHICVHDEVAHVIVPLIFLCLTMAVHVLWHAKQKQLSN